MIFSARQHSICLARYMLSLVRLSHEYGSVKKSEIRTTRIMKFLPYGNPIPLVFLQDKFHPEILIGTPRSGATNKGGVGKLF